MNNQVLRSGAFSGPSLDAALPVLADRNSFSLVLRGVSPRADHLDLLLFVVSLVDKAPHPRFGAEVSFTTRQFLSTMGWALNTDGYARAVRLARELRRVELEYRDSTDYASGRIHVDSLFASLTLPDKNSRDQKWSVVLPATLFRIYDLRRNAVIDLNARAAIRSEFGRWLHGFFSSQEPGRARSYDARALCEAGGLHSTRLSDSIKHLRSNLAILAAGEVVTYGKGRRFEPVIGEGWQLAQDKAGYYVLEAVRTGPPPAVARSLKTAKGGGRLGPLPGQDYND
jgi:hypothetical protein